MPSLRSLTRNDNASSSGGSADEILYFLSSVDSLLDVRVDCNHALVQLWMLADENLRVPCHRDEKGVDAAGQRSREAVCDLEADEESVSYNDRRKVSVRVVSWGGEVNVKVSEESAGVGYECAAHGKDRTDKALVHQCVDAAI